MAGTAETTSLADSAAFDDSGALDKFLTFILGAETYGLDMLHVTEIIGVQKVTCVPDMPDFVIGVINLRGNVIPVMDIRLRFKMETRDYDDRTCIIVVNVEETTVGMIVDTVSEVLDIPKEQIELPPSVGREGNKFMKGLGKIKDEVIILLDVDKLLHEQELEVIASATESAKGNGEADS